MIIVAALLSFAIGFFIVVFLVYLVRQNIIREAKIEAEELITNAENTSEELVNERRLEFEEFKHELEGKYESEIQQISDKVDSLKESLDETRNAHNQKLDLIRSQIQRKQSKLDKKIKSTESIFNRSKSVKKELSASKTKYLEQLKHRVGPEVEAIKENLKKTLEEESLKSMNKWSQNQEEYLEQTAERKARRIIDIALNRFARPYCPERGIQYVDLKNEKTRNKVFGPDKAYLKIVEKECGVDLIFREEMNSISVSGFDPVRRELGRASLERLVKENQLNEEKIKSTILKTKKNLFKKIKTDGTKLMKSLRIKKMSPEIINMMGALRYRYSYAQNQYFHCSEVGFLCGLLSEELGLSSFEGRRSGVLHDIGKAMDHSIDGGHAVIGADFIEKHGESEKVVHAVRAHHYDIQPEDPLCYLVIAADALSGARPGARRSTADAYMQKMGQLEQIGNSFKEVTDTFIMSAGREVRVTVDSRKVDDSQALELSKKIAAQIEEECRYPGLIKVTVVRKSEAIEMAK